MRKSSLANKLLVLKSGGYKISALDIEREILGLEYVAEVMVVGVEDEEFGQRVAAAVVLRPGVSLLLHARKPSANMMQARTTLNLEILRSDLREMLVGYKMPTMLRVVHEIPKSPTGKVVKKVLGPELFPLQGHAEVQIWKSKRTASKL